MIVIFGGTTEGREIAASLAASGERVLVSVTSEYAKALLPADIPCHVGRLDRGQMMAFLEQQKPDKVIDATHPFANLARENIRECCETLCLPLERIQRLSQTANWHDAVEWVDDTQAAVAALKRTSGAVLLTTGSKTIGEYASLPVERLWVRILPTHAALELCLNAGVPASHIIAMQGPFTESLNGAMYDMLGISTIVTKDSGKAGGVDEKIIPALARGIHVIVIRRPADKGD